MKQLLKTTLLTVTITLGSLSANEGAPDIVNGAQVWSEVCMRCHNLRQPADLSTRAWKFSMNHMRVRAGLTREETENILAFILQSKSDMDAK